MERNVLRPATASNLVGLLESRALHQGDDLAYTFLSDGESDEISVTYRDLDRRARAIASQLQSTGARGSRALLLYPSGLEYIQAFLGCLYAGVVAVPAYPPRKNQSLDRIDSIVTNAEATHVLATSSILRDIERQFAEHPHLEAMHRLATDQLPTELCDAYSEFDIKGEDLAFLQYTSGSTDHPKGVMVSHANLMHNQALMNSAFGLGDGDRVLGWLPLYHDMGLIGNVLHSLYCGVPCVLMAPVTFLQKPIRWLDAITRHRATVSGGPNFAYDLCVRKISEEQREGLDLSSWTVALNGSEPIRAATLNNFADAFGPYGFRKESFFPCYGLAEATLFVSGGPRQQTPRIDCVDPDAFATNRICPVACDAGEPHALVSSGHVWEGQKLQIVNPETLQVCSDGEVGEIWLASGSVTQGYWKRPDETKDSFDGHVAGSNNGAALRTGDLGFRMNEALFVTGRLKDLIIIRGRNHYPQDIEATVGSAHAAVRAGCAAAFSIDVDGEEQLAVVTEVTRTAMRDLDADAVSAAIRKAISTAHELYAHTIVLIKTGSLPKTTSGKIQRRKCRQDLLTGSLLIVGTEHTFCGDGSGVEADLASEISVRPTAGSHAGSNANGGAPNGNGIASNGIASNGIASNGIASNSNGNGSTAKSNGHQPLTRVDLLKPDTGARADALAAHIQRLLARARKTTPDDINIEEPLSNIGLDSLDLAELTATIENDMQLIPPSLESMQDLTIRELVGRLAIQLGVGGETDATDAIAGESANGTATPSDLFAKCDTDKGYFGKYRLAGDKYFTQPVLEGPIGPRMRFDGRDVVVWSVNNYLGIANHPHVADRARATLETHGTWAPMGSRLLTGNTERHMALESRLAGFLGKESSIVFNFGYMGVIGTINALVEESDTVIIDSLSHACIVDGALLASRGKQFRVFRHNDMESLEDQLRAANANRRGGVLVVTEGLFGMTGDLATLPEICDLKEQYDARLFIDDAHGFGIMGPTGAGTAEHLGVQDRVDLYFGTFAKSFAAIGGVTAGDRNVVDYIRYNARPNIFAKSLPMIYVESVDAAMDIVEAEGERRDQVWHISRKLQKGLIDLGFTVGSTESPITPVYIPAGDEETATRAMKLMRSEYGVFVSAVTYPVVPRGVVLFRLTATAAHTDQDVDETLEAFRMLRDQLGLALTSNGN
ncbi:MAG: aminotransferase class I/II-fold pyridoxal phosphate-dependent enzyme [Bacteroidetes bacterium]|nr:aminotransferase class I/II-fold pyridoxal phosphate-dependent enzyme [Bacteroidota bacterium]